MIARVAVHLPVPLWAPNDTSFESFDIDLNGTKLLVHPPAQSAFEIRPGEFAVNDLIRQLQPVQQPSVYEYIRMNGSFVKHVDLLEIDFIRAQFERSAGSAHDPDPRDVETIVANIVARLRYTTGAIEFREFSLSQTFWTVRYLDDDGNPMPEEKGMVRARVSAPFKFVFSGLDPESWSTVRALDLSFQPHPWERLYLDAPFKVGTRKFNRL